MSRKWRVVRDYQGGSFGMGRDYTSREWAEQAIEWLEADGCDDIDEWRKSFDDMLQAGDEDGVIAEIASVWDLEFEEIVENSVEMCKKSLKKVQKKY